MDKNHLQQVNNFIREHRSQEASFEKLNDLLEREIAESEGPETYQNTLIEIKEKTVPAYNKAREAGNSAWPEFEKFSTAFEKAVLDALKNE